VTGNRLNASYAIIRHNVRTYRSDGVVEVVKGEQNARLALQNLEACQSSEDHHEGWRYFLEKSELKAGTDPAQATDVRQAELEEREFKAMNPVDGERTSQARNPFQT
jgi:hypothetical protein